MKQKQALKDIGLMSFMAIFSIVLITFAIPKFIKLTDMQAAESFTARTFPTIIAWGILFFSVIGLMSAIVRYISVRKEEGPIEHSKENKEKIIDILFPYIMYVLILIYGILFQNFGYIISTAIVPPIMLFSMKCRKWYMYVALYVFAALVYVLFKFVLKVPIK